MKAKTKRDRNRLMANAKAVLEHLQQQNDGERFRLRKSLRIVPSNTDGWFVVIGGMGRRLPQIQVWLDHFAGYAERKLYACFFQTDMRRIGAITKRVQRRLFPVRTIDSKDTNDGHFVVLKERLRRSEFNAPILEKYSDRGYFGIYDSTRATSQAINPHFCDRAAAFFEDVARSMPNAKNEEHPRDVYPKYENRKRVRTHLYRERSRFLAIERKIRDRYKCQVCGMQFEKVYGMTLGQGFAEAHHIIPLAQLSGNVKTRISDLRTVCANCHRMLHKMSGRRDDVVKLKAIVHRNRRCSR